MKTEHDEALVERMTDAIERAIDCQMNCSAPRGVTKRIYARAFAIAALETLPARDEAVPASKLGPIPSVESFAINPVGEGDITVEASSRFVHERDMAKVMKWARAAEAALASSTSPASAPGSGVRVKPLEWEQPEPDWWDVYDRALQIGYAVNQRRDGSVRLRVPGETSFAIFAGSVEEAKAAAQADFEQRIRSALDASPSPPETREAVETEREACARVAEDKASTKDFRARMVIAAAIRARGQS